MLTFSLFCFLKSVGLPWCKRVVGENKCKTSEAGEHTVTNRSKLHSCSRHKQKGEVLRTQYHYP
jgi:hypothetical protein